jgi:septal ring factor EnvC (AmiA/AmiB activator)
VEKIITFIFVSLIAFSSTGCRTTGTRISKAGGVDYIKPASIEAAQYGIDERIETLERQLRESRQETATIRGAIADCRSEIGRIRESCETIILAGGRSGDIIQETLEQAEALYRWVMWANSRLLYLENILMAQIQD